MNHNFGKAEENVFLPISFFIYKRFESKRQSNTRSTNGMWDNATWACFQKKSDINNTKNIITKHGFDYEKRNKTESLSNVPVE